jgi:hypothetical protein
MTVGKRGGVEPAASDPGVQMHAMENSLASLRLRLAVLADDQRWEGDPNIVALVRIADHLMSEMRAMRESIAALAPPRRTRTRRT